MLVVRVGTVGLQIRIPDQSVKVLIKNAVLNSVLLALESKGSLIPVPCLSEKGLKVKFNQFGAVITEQRGVERTAKKVNRRFVILQFDDGSEQPHVVITTNIKLGQCGLSHADYYMIVALYKATIRMPEVKKVIGQKSYVDYLLGKMKKLSFPRKLGCRAI